MKKNICVLGLSFMLLSSCGFYGLTSCNSDSGSERNDTIILSNDETIVFNAIRNSLSMFKDPSSVTLRYVSTENLIGGRYVIIAAKNSFGAYVDNTFQIVGSTSLKSASPNSFNVDPSISVSKINTRLKEYINSLGW